MKRFIIAAILLILVFAVIRESLAVRRLTAERDDLLGSRPAQQRLHPRTTEAEPPPTTPSSRPDIPHAFPESLNHADRDPFFVSISGDGTLARHTIRELGLDAQQTSRVNQALARVRQKAAEDFSNRLRRLPANPGGTTIHYARARKDRGKELLDSLADDLSESVGETLSTKLMKSLVVDSFIGAMGRFDMEIETFRTEQGIRRVKHRYLSPKTGAVSRFGETSLENFENKFGIEWSFSENN